MCSYISAPWTLKNVCYSPQTCEHELLCSSCCAILSKHCEPPQIQHTLVMMQPVAGIYSVTMVTPCPPWKAAFELLPTNWQECNNREMCPLLISRLQHVPVRTVQHLTSQRTGHGDEVPTGGGGRLGVHGSMTVQLEIYGWWWIGAQMNLDIPSFWKNMNYTVCLCSGGRQKRRRDAHSVFAVANVPAHTLPFCLFVFGGVFFLFFFFLSFSQCLK